MTSFFYIDLFNALTCCLLVRIAPWYLLISERICFFSPGVSPLVFNCDLWLSSECVNPCWCLNSCSTFFICIPEITKDPPPFLPGFIFILNLRGADFFAALGFLPTVALFFLCATFFF